MITKGERERERERERELVEQKGRMLLRKKEIHTEMKKERKK